MAPVIPCDLTGGKVRLSRLSAFACMYSAALWSLSSTVRCNPAFNLPQMELKNKTAFKGLVVIKQVCVKVRKKRAVAPILKNYPLCFSLKHRVPTVLLPLLQIILVSAFHVTLHHDPICWRSSIRELVWLYYIYMISWQYGHFFYFSSDLLLIFGKIFKV